MTNSYIKQQAEQMAARRQELAARHAAEGAPTPDKRQTDMRPLHERVEAVLKRLTPAEIEDGIRIEWLCEQLSGKYRGNAQPGAVGAALRRLGWHRVRSWRNDDEGFRATWHKENK